VTSPFEGEPPGGFHHSVCGGAVSPDEAYEEFRSGFDDVPSHDSPEFYSTPFWKRHDHCKPWTSFAREAARKSSGQRHQVTPPILSFAMLGTCRQMYEEASFLLWTTNTFSFEKPISLKTFIE